MLVHVQCVFMAFGHKDFSGCVIGLGLDISDMLCISFNRIKTFMFNNVSFKLTL